MDSNQGVSKKTIPDKQGMGKQNQKIRYAINVVVIAALAIVFYIGIRPPRVEVTDSSMKVSGLYGVELRVADIQSLELQDTIPEIQARTNGMDLFGFARRGIYELEGLGRTRLISFSYGGPFIFMNTGHEWVIMNFKNPEDTEALYNKLEQAISNNTD